jgi:hypothetical protein
MVRQFKTYSIATSSTPQPLVGTTLTAALSAQSNPDATYTATVADSSMFFQGSFFVVGKPSTGQERVLVQAIPSGTTVTLKGVLKNSYVSTTFVTLGTAINSTYVQTKDGNAAVIYIGIGDAMSTTAYVAKLQAVGSGSQPTEFHDGRSSAVNADDSAGWWIEGTSGDSYVPSFGVV